MSLQQEKLADKMLRLEGCRAARGCRYALGPAGEVLDMLAGVFRKVRLKSRLLARIGGTPHYHQVFKAVVAGCVNACSQPQISDIGVILTGHPQVIIDRCSACGVCREACREGAISEQSDGMPVIDRSICLACGQCIASCPAQAMHAVRQGFRLLAGGKLGRHPVLAKEVGEYQSLPALANAVEDLLERYLEQAGPEERMADFLNRVRPDINDYEERVEWN